MRLVFGRLKDARFLLEISREEFCGKAAHFLAELNAIHPFRDGNGRTQLSFLGFVAARAGHPLDMAGLDPGRFLAAMIASFHGNEGPLRNQIRRLLRPPI